MRLLSLTFVLMISTIGLAQQQELPTVDTGGNNAAANNVSSGSSQVPQGFGSGGESDNLSAAFGERTSTIGATGFIGGNMNAQQGGFVGQNQTINGGAGQNNFGNRGQFGNLGGVQNGGRGGQRFQQQLQQRRIRTRLVLPKDFAPEFRVVPRAKLQDTISGQYRSIDAMQAQSKLSLGSSRVFANADIQVTAIDRTVTLRGQVGSDRERKLAGRIAKFEPGVDRVENLLTVVETPQ